MEKDWKADWNQRYTADAEKWREPDAFFAEAYDQFIQPAFPNGGRALDVAGGMGRHAMWLAERGWRVTIVDFAEVALKHAREAALSSNLPVDTVEADVLTYDFSRRQYDLVMTFYFLERPILPRLIDAVAPGGFLLYKTYTIDQLPFGKGPKDPAYLLHRDELLEVFRDLHVVHYREQTTDGARAEILARKI